MFEPLLYELTVFINKSFAYDLPFSTGEFINAARLIGLWKDDAKIDVRPISIGNSIRRLTARCALPYVLPLAESTFGTDQFGAGTSNGTDSAVHILRHLVQAALDSDTDFIVMSRDAKNAFNEIDQNVVFDGVAECMPLLKNYLKFVYGSDAPQVFGTAGTVHMRAGVFQGDPLSALLFCFVPRQLWKTLQSQPVLHGIPIDWNQNSKVLYMDDTFIAGPSAQVFAIAKSMSEIGAPLGLIAVPKKDQFCRPNPLALADNSSLALLDHLFDVDGNLLPGVTLPPHCSIKFSPPGVSMLDMPNGIKVLGSFVSPICSSTHTDVDETLMIQFVGDIVKSTLVAHSKLRQVDEFQDRLMLLRQCASSMSLLGHLARTIPSRILHDGGILGLDDSVMQLVSEMLQGPSAEYMSLEELEQIHPHVTSFFVTALRDGGMGLRLMELHRSAALISSTSATLRKTHMFLTGKVIGKMDIASIRKFDLVQSDLINDSVQIFNEACDFEFTAKFIRDNAKSSSKFIPRTAITTSDLSYSSIKSASLSARLPVSLQQRVLSRTIDLALRCKLFSRAESGIPSDGGYALMRLQHLDANSVLFLKAKPDFRAGTLLSNTHISYGLQFYTDTQSSFAFRDKSNCAHTLRPLARHSIVACQAAGESTQRHEEIMHAITDTINQSFNNNVALANPNLVYTNPRASSSQNSAETQGLKPADILVNGKDCIDVTVVDPRSKDAVSKKYYQDPSRVFQDAIKEKQRKYLDVVRRDNRTLSVFAFSHFGMPHYYVMKTLKKYIYSSVPHLRPKCVAALWNLRIKISLACFARAASSIENHLRPANVNVQRQVMNQTLTNRLNFATAPATYQDFFDAQ